MAIDWSDVWAQFKGKWVALGDDEVTVLGSGDTAKDAWQQARDHGHRNPILAHMPKTLDTYVGAV